MAPSVVDELFARVTPRPRPRPRPYPTGMPVVTRSQNKAKMSNLDGDGLAGIMVQALRLIDGEFGTAPGIEAPNIAYMKRICNKIRNLKLIGKRFNQIDSLGLTFAEMAGMLHMDPVEVAHRAEEDENGYFARVKALLQERCAFLANLGPWPAPSHAYGVHLDTAGNAITLFTIGGRADVGQTHAERIARALWYCKYGNRPQLLFKAIQNLLVQGWSNEDLELSQFPNAAAAATTPVNLTDKRVIFTFEGAEYMGYVLGTNPDAEPLAVYSSELEQDRAARGLDSRWREVPRADVRLAPTRQDTAVKWLLELNSAARLTDRQFADLIRQSAVVGDTHAAIHLIYKRSNVLDNLDMRTALGAAVKNGNEFLVMQIASREALAPDPYSHAEEFVNAGHFDAAYQYVDTPAKMALCYVPFRANPPDGTFMAPREFYRRGATADELANWQRVESDAITRNRMVYLNQYVIDEVGYATDLATVEAIAHVPSHPMQSVDALTLIQHLGKVHANGVNQEGAIALARNLYPQLRSSQHRSVAKSSFAAAQLD